MHNTPSNRQDLPQFSQTRSGGGWGWALGLAAVVILVLVALFAGIGQTTVEHPGGAGAEPVVTDGGADATAPAAPAPAD